MGKSFKTKSALPSGHVDVADELVERFGRAQIRLAIQQLRLNGAYCRRCRKSLKAHHLTSLVVDLGAAGASFGFICFEHGPSQILDPRRDRRESNEMMVDLEDRYDDSYGFASFREYPSPCAMLTISPQVPVRFMVGEREVVDPWLTTWIEAGFELVTGPTIDVVPAVLDNWTVHVSAFDIVRVTNGTLTLYDGQLELPGEWKQAVIDDGQCAVFAAATSIESDELGIKTQAACDFLASSGDLVAATIKVEAPIEHRGGLIIVRNGATVLY